MDEIQENIKALRAAGWTLAAVAGRLQVDWDTLKRWENGDRKPQARGAILMAFEVLLQEEPSKRKRYPGTHHLQRDRKNKID